MEFTNEFVVPTDIDTTFDTLTDLERVAPCLPGATLDEVDGDTHHGQVKVRVGPMQMVYRGTARVAEADRAAHRGRIEAAGNETRGSGTARADVTATLSTVDGGTRVVVVTDLQVTGRPAQFGRGVLAEVGANIIGTFADRLREMLEADDAAGTTHPAADAPRSPASDAGTPTTSGRGDDSLDLVSVARGAAVRRLVPLLAGIVVVAGVVWWFAGR